MPDKKQKLVFIKGTRDGITLVLNESCDYKEALSELKNKMTENKPQSDSPIVPVTVELGNRYLDQEQEKELRHVIESENHFSVESIESNVISKEDAERLKESSEVKVFHQIVRSGQVLSSKGDLLLVGDVNPGGKVQATGNIYILGNLYGIAHAGSEGDNHCFIAASFMKPTQLRIAEYIRHAPDDDSEGAYMECGLVDEVEDKIIIDKLQSLSRIRNKISGFERRVNHG